jgi:hypothetical protein
MDASVTSRIATLGTKTDGRRSGLGRYLSYCGPRGAFAAEKTLKLCDVFLGPEEEPCRMMQPRPRRTEPAQDVAEGGFGEPEASTDVAGGDGRFHVAPPKRRHAGKATMIQPDSAPFSGFQETVQLPRGAPLRPAMAIAAVLPDELLEPHEIHEQSVLDPHSGFLW